MKINRFKKNINKVNSNKYPALHFLPGNSFTPCSYSTLLDGFNDTFLIKIFLLRSLWGDDSKPKFNNWSIFLHDYINTYFF